jgi:hypothetical protein
MVKITKAFVYRGRPATGGWTKRQLEILGVPWPPQDGWIKRITGNTLTDEAAAEFLRRW